MSISIKVASWKINRALNKNCFHPDIQKIKFKKTEDSKITYKKSLWFGTKCFVEYNGDIRNHKAISAGIIDEINKHEFKSRKSVKPEDLISIQNVLSMQNINPNGYKINDCVIIYKKDLTRFPFGVYPSPTKKNVPTIFIYNPALLKQPEDSLFVRKIQNIINDDSTLLGKGLKQLDEVDGAIQDFSEPIEVSIKRKFNLWNAFDRVEQFFNSIGDVLNKERSILEIMGISSEEK